MKPNLIINISKSKHLSFQLDKNAEILDLSNTLIIDNKISPSDFFEASIVYPQALNFYKEFCGKIVSTPSLLNIKINKLPVYWLTPCAVKHPIKHWGKDFFLLLAVLEVSKNHIEQNYSSLTVVIPNEIELFKTSIIKYLKINDFSIPYSILAEKTSKKTTLSTIVKTFWWQLKKLNKYKPETSDEQIEYLHLMSSLKKTHQYETSYLELKKLLKDNEKNIAVLPIFEWLQDESFNPIMQDFLKAKPTKTQLVKLFFEYNLAYIKIQLLPNTNTCTSSINLPSSFLKQELISSLNKSSRYFFSHLWLNNYFKTIQKPIKVFFDDEFYEFGRTISAASKTNSKIATFGLQHGNFNEIHTVYSIYDAEIKNGIPIPTHFITWGGIYNQLFLINNSLPKNYTLALGNPKYINNNQEAVLPIKIKKVLWCLTTKECMDIEWNCIKNAITQTNYNLNIRLHPLKHISEEEVTQKLQDVRFTFQNEGNIQQTIAHNDLIISSAHSTTFLDAIVAKKYGIRITSRFWNGSLNMDNAVLKTVKNEEEFKSVFQFMQNAMELSKESTTNSLLQLSDEKWRKFLANLNYA